MQVTVAGAVESARVADVLQNHFDGFGDARKSGRDSIAALFSPEIKHYDKELEQQQRDAEITAAKAAKTTAEATKK